MILKQFFDILESKWLKISSHLFVEKRNWGNHVWIIVEFNWKIFLIDPFINKNFSTPISKLEQSIQDRMKRIMPTANEVEDIESNDINSIIEKYSKNNEENYKVIVGSIENLVLFLNNIPNKSWYIWLNDKFLFDILKWHFSFRFFNNWILLSGCIFYEFDNKLDENELNKIPDNKLISYLFDHITYKTNKEYWERKIKVFSRERAYFSKKLKENSYRINFERRRKILLGNNKYHPK